MLPRRILFHPNIFTCVLSTAEILLCRCNSSICIYSFNIFALCMFKNNRERNHFLLFSTYLIRVFNHFVHIIYITYLLFVYSFLLAVCLFTLLSISNCCCYIQFCFLEWMFYFLVFYLSCSNIDVLVRLMNGLPSFLKASNYTTFSLEEMIK